MEDKKIKIIDGSGDRKHFTILPNYILNHSTADEQALYMQMKRFAGERGVCFATQRTLANKLSWGSKKRPNRERVKKNIDKLLKRGWVECIGKKDAKTHPIDVYKITDIWQINSEFYKKKKGQSNRHISTKKKRKDGLSVTRKDGLTPLEEEPIKEEEEDIVPTPSEEMNLFLKDSKFFNQIAEEFAKKSKFSLKVILDQLEKFKDYWSEKNRSGKKQCWELKKTFELRRRFATWLRNAEKYGDIIDEVEVTKL